MSPSRALCLEHRSSESILHCRAPVAAFSLEPDERAQLVRECRAAALAMGEVRYEMAEQEKKSLQFRRSLYTAEDMRAGDVLMEKNLRRIRPGHGLSPKHYDALFGKKVRCDVKRGTPMSWALVE